MEVIQANVLDFNTGKSVDTISLNKSIFALPQNNRHDTLVKNIIQWQRDKKNTRSHKTKNISEVSGTGKKPHAQKGSGRARKSSLRANHMRGGAIVHGPRGLKKSISSPNKKMRKLGIKYALSNKLKEKSILIVKEIILDKISTKNLKTIMSSNLSLPSSTIFCVDKLNELLLLSARNIPNCKVIEQNKIGVYDILKYKSIVFSSESIKILQDKLL